VACNNCAIVLTYVIGNTVSAAGANGYTMTVGPATAAAIAGNAAQPIIYQSIASTATSHANTIEALNGTTGISTFSSQAIGGSAVLAISDDGQYLYTPNLAGVAQILASTLAVSQSIPGAGGLSIAVAPGQPQTFAAASMASLQIFDGAVARPNAMPFCATNCGVSGLQWGTTTSVIYAQYHPGAGAPYPECSFAVNASGLTGAPISCSSTNTSPFNFANGLGYVSGGTVVDATTWATIATLSAPNVTLDTVFPDTSTGKAFAIATNSSTNECTLQTFNLTSNAPIANLHVPSNGSYCGADIVRWGSNGLALNAGYSGATGYILLISGPFVGP
jgi:hypothetical protein